MSDPHGSFWIFLWPKPAVVFWLLNQASADWILADVVQLFFETLLGAEDVVEGFFLPDRAARTRELVNGSG